MMVKSKRSLRKQVRKDYQKINSGVDEELDNEGASSSAEIIINVGDQNKVGHEVNKQIEDGASEVVHSERDSDVKSDDEIENAEKKLKELKREKRKLLEKRKLEHIDRETKEIQKELEKLKGNSKNLRRADKTVTVKSLRGMSDVVNEVDQLMDKKFSLKSSVSSASDDSLYSDDSSSESGTDSDKGRSKLSSGSDTDDNKKRKKDRSRKKKKGGYHKSGKNRKLTSYVKYPQRWANTQLALHFACAREKKLEELSIAEFCAGFITILETSSNKKREHRMAHLKELMYLATRYQWRNVLSYHAACLTEIERGHLSWGDNFQMLQSTTLAGGVLHSSHNSSRGNFAAGARSGAGSGGGAKEQGTVWCRFYQRGTCSYSTDHMGNLDGERRFMKHICAKCWNDHKKVELHPETSDECPSK